MTSLHTWLHGSGTLISACLLILSAPLDAAPKPDKDLKQVRGRIETLQKELATTETSKSETATALHTSEQAIDAINRKLATLAQARSEADGRLGQLQAQFAQVTGEIGIQRSRLTASLHRQYVSGGGEREYLSLLLNHQDPNRIARHLHYHGYLVRARLEDIDTLQANSRRLDALARESQEKSREIATIEARQAIHRKELELKKTEHKILLTQISAKIEKQKREIGALKRDEERLSRLVQEIAKKLAAKNRAAPRSGSRTEPLSNDRLPDASTDGNPFAALKGRLSLPVRGEVTNRFGGSRADGGLTWKGLFIRSAAGTEVRSVASGRVVFADWLRGFGNLMIVDHGGSYMSLYGNNDAIRKQVGDNVRSGDTIATVGNSGDNADSGLYFELRHQGKPFDPLNWVRIK
ncbi:murein hydrolase activator EnvC [Nitrosovibrio sp. Nv17]|uniref:murein hydrolase activator EnvC family protein n=1 Tax=Nitrosovibrio sp. Nv17 TaxID=1855339 RepID=UPI0009086956|nr:peptidoglycan DD-metalloendopeptidase family protein [Nitrosovibrio sp. Nv17]SFW34066.1 Septal ring factor EnvC, activator of murein hydrolases AmiA and AmiB [Nitrosovibrio sp. Nv17]